MTLFLEVFPTGPLQANCTLLGDTEAGEVVVIDPGDEAELIAGRLSAAALQPTMILHTHGHFDHIGGSADLARRLGGDLRIGLHRDDLAIYRQGPLLAEHFGLEVEAPPEPDLWLDHGARITVGAIELEVRHTPGHSPGGVSFVAHGVPEAFVIAGDVLFAGSIGRTDLPGGSFAVLKRSIHEQIYTLADDTRVITGHGPLTTVGREKRANPFVRAL
jgi:hydroxyacylglutathione hydrolase